LDSRTHKLARAFSARAAFVNVLPSQKRVKHFCACARKDFQKLFVFVPAFAKASARQAVLVIDQCGRIT